MSKHITIDKVIIALALLQLDHERAFCAVVDVGAGTGLFARLIRYLLPGRYWSAIEARSARVEAFELKSLYDKVYVSDVRYLDMQTLPKGGGALLGSLLERMSLEDAIQTVARLLTVNDYVFLSIRLSSPLSEAPEADSLNGVPHLWSGADLALLPGGTHAVYMDMPDDPSHGQMVIMVCANSKQAQGAARHALAAALEELAGDGGVMPIYEKSLGDLSGLQPLHRIQRQIIQRPFFESSLMTVMHRLLCAETGKLDHEPWHPEARQQWLGFLIECYNVYRRPTTSGNRRHRHRCPLTILAAPAFSRFVSRFAIMKRILLICRALIPPTQKSRIVWTG
ncbi:MAG: hypothetical protein HQL80_00065 [Magnetococcales bacterium]|nr:hypothetical protein [Magnetococcales bacterium]